MTSTRLQDVYEQYKHLDHMLSDQDWMAGAAGEATVLRIIVCDLWRAVKGHVSALPESAESALIRHGLAEQWSEITDALKAAGHPLSNENGHLVLLALQGLIAERDELRLLLNNRKETSNDPQL